MKNMSKIKPVKEAPKPDMSGVKTTGIKIMPIEKQISYLKINR